jgi:hypothetical protein
LIRGNLQAEQTHEYIYGKTSAKEQSRKSGTIREGRGCAKFCAAHFERGDFRFERVGRIAERGSGSLLLCDFDEGKRAPNYRGICHVLRTLGLVPLRVLYRRTRKGWHVVLEHNGELSPTEQVCAQFALGSDRKRELLNLMRVMRLPNAPKFWRERWNLLYGYKLK